MPLGGGLGAVGVGVRGVGAGGAAWMTAVCSAAWSNTLVSATVSSTQSFEPMSVVVATYLSDVAPAIGEQSLSSVAEHRSHCQVCDRHGVAEPRGGDRERLSHLRRSCDRDQGRDSETCADERRRAPRRGAQW